jgi:hypothetical protein
VEGEAPVPEPGEPVATVVLAVVVAAAVVVAVAVGVATVLGERVAVRSISLPVVGSMMGILFFTGGLAKLDEFVALGSVGTVPGDGIA